MEDLSKTGGFCGALPIHSAQIKTPQPTRRRPNLTASKEKGVLSTHSACSLIKRFSNSSAEKSCRKSLLTSEPAEMPSPSYQPPHEIGKAGARATHSLLKEPFTTEVKGKLAASPQVGSWEEARSTCWLQPRVGWVQCQWHSRANLSDESPFQFLPFMSNQMTRGWQDKLSDAAYPEGAQREVLPVQGTPAQPSTHHLHIHAPLGCSPAMTVSITTDQPPALQCPSAHSSSPFYGLTAALGQSRGAVPQLTGTLHDTCFLSPHLCGQ